MIGQELKNKAIKLRESGESYNSIRNKLNISKGTLYSWFGDEDWSIAISVKNSNESKISSRLRIMKLNEGRRLQIDKDRNRAKEEAEEEFNEYKDNPLFIGALMIYLGEGDKAGSRSRVGVSNTDPFVIKIFINFLLKFCSVERQDLRMWVLCYPDHSIEECELWWAEKTGISRRQFNKTQVIQGRHKTKRLLYGVGNIIISRSLLKVKILRWIELASSRLLRL